MEVNVTTAVKTMTKPSAATRIPVNDPNLSAITKGIVDKFLSEMSGGSSRSAGPSRKIDKGKGRAVRAEEIVEDQDALAAQIRKLFDEKRNADGTAKKKKRLNGLSYGVTRFLILALNVYLDKSHWLALQS